MNTPQHPILIGTSGWSYPDWVGPFYPDGMESADFLEYYAHRFPIVEVDSSFYRPPSAAMVRTWRSRTPDSFRFALKVPRSISHEKRLRDCEAEVDGFVSSILPLGPKAWCALLQMGYFNPGIFHSLNDFLDLLDGFLLRWPHATIPLAVEIRNPRWVGKELVTLLRSHGAALTLTEQSWMPTPSAIVRKLDPVTADFSFVRLLGDRQGIEKVTTTWDKIVVDRSADLEATAGVIQSVAERVPVAVFANNHYAGFSPETNRQLRQLLGQAEPTPPPRRRTTLFD